MNRRQRHHHIPSPCHLCFSSWYKTFAGGVRTRVFYVVSGAAPRDSHFLVVLCNTALGVVQSVFMNGRVATAVRAALATVTHVRLLITCQPRMLFCGWREICWCLKKGVNSNYKTRSIEIIGNNYKSFFYSKNFLFIFIYFIFSICHILQIIILWINYMFLEFIQIKLTVPLSICHIFFMFKNKIKRLTGFISHFINLFNY